MSVAPRTLLLVAPLLLLAACARPSSPQVTGPLAIDIPELCTRCVEVLECEGTGARTAYVMAEKSSGAQIATIWDYFAAFFRPKIEDFRDLTVYELGPDGAVRRSESGRLQARLDVWKRRVELPEGRVLDQQSAKWLTAEGSPLGRCRHLAAAEARARARELSAAPPRGTAAGTGAGAAGRTPP